MKHLAVKVKNTQSFLVGVLVLFLLLPIQLPAQGFLGRVFKTGKYARYKCRTMGAYNKHRKDRLKKESSHRNYKTLPPGTVTQASPRNRKDLRPPVSRPPTPDTNEPEATVKKKGQTPNEAFPAKPSADPQPNLLTKKPFKELTQEQRRQTLKEKTPEVVLPPIRFITAQDEFSVVNMDSFMEAMEYAKQGKVVLIEGHTDDVGSSDSNLKLSMKRAEKIRELMLSGGVSDDFISVIGFGEDKPLVPNTSAENRAVNRRIEFKVFSVPE
jgi:outer membrane protein OmpA-like peptidoglycan-associated protein